jgi:hypothetical protein
MTAPTLTAGIVCGRCSHWADGKRVQVRHTSIAAVRSCQTTLATVRTAPAAWSPVAGRYALTTDGVTKFYVVDLGKEGSRWAGRVFLSVQASDELHPVRNPGTRADILAAIGTDPAAALRLYGREIGRCGVCGRTLTDEASRAAGIGPICADKGF